MTRALATIAVLLLAAACGGGESREPAPEREPTPNAAVKPPPAPAPRPEPIAAPEEPAPAADPVAPDGGTSPEDSAGDQPAPSSPFTAAGRPMLIDFTRDHCLPCDIMHPWIVDLQKRYGEKVDIVEINIDRPENKPIGLYFKARSIPTQVYVDAAGREVGRHVGLARPKEMRRALRRHGFISD